VFWFTCCLAAFAVIQAGYALTIDSLGLLSDAMHMFFHVGALGISLIGMVYARRPATFAYSYGFDRFEVLAAFSNSLFLIFVVLFVLAGALQRLLQPSVFDTDAALNLEFGIIGLLINVAGMFAIGPGGSALEHLARFQRSASGASLGGGGGASGAPAAVADRGRSFVAFDGQAAAGAARAAIVHPFLGTAMSPSSASAAAAVGSGGGSGGAYGAGATASAGGGGGGPFSGGPSGGPSGVGGPNTQAIFLHFFSDGLSSLAVIVSSLLVRYRGVAAADTLQCFAVSAFTLWIVIPLFTATARILLQMVPAGLAGSLDRCRRQVSVIEGVLEVYDEHYWLQAPGCVVGSLCLRIAGDDASAPGGAGGSGGGVTGGGGSDAAGGRGVSEAEVLARTQRIYAGLVQDLTVQIEREHGSGGARHAVSHGTSGGSSGTGSSSSGVVNGAVAVPRGGAVSGSGHGHSHGGDDHAGHGHDSHGHGHAAHGHSHGGPAAAPAAPAAASVSVYPVGSRAAAAAIPFPAAATAAPSSSLTPAGAAAARTAAASTAAQSALARADAWLSSAGLAPGPGVAASAGFARPTGTVGVAGAAGPPTAPAWAPTSAKPHGGLPAVANPFAAPALTVPVTAAPAAAGVASDASPPPTVTAAAAPAACASHASAHGHSHPHAHAHGGLAAAAGHAAGDSGSAESDAGSNHGHSHSAGGHGHSHGGSGGHEHAEAGSHGHSHG
jgi:cation diffusion facilitator family transporter